MITPILLAHVEQLKNTSNINLDTQLNSAMRIVSRTVKSTPTQWLPVLTNILPPSLRRKEALLRTTIKADKTKRFLLNQMLRNTPNVRLKSRKPPWSTAKELALSNFEGTKEWRETGHQQI